MRAIYILITILYLTATVTIILTNYVDGYENLLSQMSYENSFFESIGTLFLFGGFLYGTYNLFRYKFTGIDKNLIIIFSAILFVASMEEISWGQQIFNFPSSKYFLEYNLQEETNLHNLISGNLFSSIIYSTVYITLIFIPLAVKLYPNLKEKLNILKYFDINIDIILIFLFASSFQLYLYRDFGVIVDMITHLFAMLLFGYFILKKSTDIKTKIHFIFIVVTTIISILSHNIYSFYNMQYEIREAFIEIGIVLIFLSFIKDRKDKILK